EIEQLSQELPQIDLEIGITGFDAFDAFEIDSLMTDLGSDAPPPADEVIEPRKGPAVARVGELFVLGDHRLLAADAREESAFAQLMGGSKARMAILDPPYNVKVQGHIGGRGRIKHREFKCASGEMLPV